MVQALHTCGGGEHGDVGQGGDVGVELLPHALVAVHLVLGQVTRPPAPGTWYCSRRSSAWASRSFWADRNSEIMEPTWPGGWAGSTHPLPVLELLLQPDVIVVQEDAGLPHLAPQHLQGVVGHWYGGRTSASPALATPCSRATSLTAGGSFAIRSLTWRQVTAAYSRYSRCSKTEQGTTGHAQVPWRRCWRCSRGPAAP